MENLVAFMELLGSFIFGFVMFLAISLSGVLLVVSIIYLIVMVIVVMIDSIF